MSDHGAGTPTNQVTTSFVHGGTTAAMPPQMRPLLPARDGLGPDGHCPDRATFERVVSTTPGATKNVFGEEKLFLRLKVTPPRALVRTFATMSS